MYTISPVELLQNLIRFDTSNPPGNERECISYIDSLLKDAGFETTLVARDPKRPNLIARLVGHGEVPPLLLYGHVDVVTTANQTWRHPPFEGKIVNGYVWGRGALDMKGGVAMLVVALLRAKADRLTPPGDVVLAILSDEEQGGEYGSRYLVENHAAMFEGIRYALGEFGGFTLYIGTKKFYPIMVVEKRPSRLRARVRGPGGHAALPFHGGATARLGHLLQQLDKGHLPSHVTSVTHHMITTLVSALQFPANLLLRLLLNPRCNDPILRLLGNKGKDFEPLFHNTVNVTVLHGGEQTSVIPSEITVDLIAHLLPGYSPEDLISELRPVIGDDVELEVIHYDPGPSEPDMGLFDTLADVLREADPHGIPVPLLLPSSTDGRVFSRIGIQTYGFLPMNLPPELNFSQTIHAADERIPVEALDFGTQAIYKVLQRFGNK